MTINMLNFCKNGGHFCLKYVVVNPPPIPMSGMVFHAWTSIKLLMHHDVRYPPCLCAAQDSIPAYRVTDVRQNW